MGLGTAEAIARIVPAAPAPVLNRVLVCATEPRLRLHCFASNPGNEFRPLPPLPPGDWRLIQLSAPRVELPLERLPETPWCIEYRWAADGSRERTPAAKPVPGVPWIGGFGDSFAFGSGVRTEHALFAAVERRLGRGVEIVNWGESGADLGRNVQRLDEMATRFACRRAILVYIANDVPVTPELAKREASSFDLINILRLAADEENPRTGHGPSRLLDRLQSGLSERRARRESVRWYRDAYDEQLNPEGLALIDGLFRELAAMPDVRVVLVVYPLMVGFRDGYPLHDVHTRVMDAARAAGLPALDLAPAFAAEDAAELWVDTTDHHPNRRAHEIAAAALAQWLRRDVPGFLE